jgi:hypothetical protein
MMGSATWMLQSYSAREFGLVAETCPDSAKKYRLAIQSEASVLQQEPIDRPC